MSKIKFKNWKAYKYVQNTHPFHILLDTLCLGLGTLAFTGIAFMVFMLVTGQLDTTNVTFGIYG